jgi:hypothetical protein
MKSEERHELQQNDFESFLYYRLPHYLRQYGSYILLVLALGFLGFQLWRMHEQKKEAHIALGWAQLSDARSKFYAALRPQQDPSIKPDNPVDAFNDVIGNFADVPVVAGKAHFSLGVYYQQLIVVGNPPVGGVTTSADQAAILAQEQFETVLRDYADQPDLIAETKLADGALLETQQKFDDARKLYEELSAEGSPYAGTAYAAEAARKLKRLPENRQPVKYGPESTWPRPSFTDSTQPASTKPTTTTTSKPAATLPATTPATTPASPAATTTSAPATIRAAATLPTVGSIIHLPQNRILTTTVAVPEGGTLLTPFVGEIETEVPR